MRICVFGAGAVGGHIAAKLAASGHDVSVVARGGHADDANTERIETLRALLGEADLYSPPTKDIRQAVWAKLVQNLSTAALCTLTGATVKEVRNDAHLKGLAARLG